MPPPKTAVLPLTVLPFRVSVGLEVMPPPLLKMLPLTVLSLRVNEPLFAMPPPPPRGTVSDRHAGHFHGVP